MGSEMIGHSCKSPAGAWWEVLCHPTMYSRRVGEELTLLGINKDSVRPMVRPNSIIIIVSWGIERQMSQMWTR